MTNTRCLFCLFLAGSNKGGSYYVHGKYESHEAALDENVVVTCRQDDRGCRVP
jgi:hypothetical protein